MSFLNFCTQQSKDVVFKRKQLAQKKMFDKRRGLNNDIMKVGDKVKVRNIKGKRKARKHSFASCKVWEPLNDDCYFIQHISEYKTKQK